MKSPPKADPFDFDVSSLPSLARMAKMAKRAKLRGLFVTGTDVGVGKTLIAGAIARQLRKSGRSVEVFKPVATGCRRTREGLVSSEAEFLAACAESRRTLAEITPVRYPAGISPNAAADRAHRPVDLDAICDAYAPLAGACDCVIVEGPGGLCTPITPEVWTIHVAMMMKLPLVIVAGAGLGTINHTLLTLAAARAAGLEVAGVVINRYRIDPAAAEALEKGSRPYTHGDGDLAVYTNPPQIVECGRVEVLTIVPDDGESSVARATLGFDVEFAIGQVDWLRIIGLK